MSDLIEIYTSVLEFAGCEVSAGGFVQAKIGDKRKNVIVEGKDLVLPIQEQLRNPTPDTVIFHPLAENELGNESDILRRLREVTFAHLNRVTSDIMLDLVSILASSELHSKLSVTAQDILYQGLKVDKKTATAISALTRKEIENYHKLLVSGFLRRGGTVKGTTVARAGIVSFPLYTKLADDGYLSDLPTGVRKADPESIRGLLKFIFPKIDTPGEYYVGSDSHVAPFFEAFLKMIKVIANDLQTVLSNFEGHLVHAADHTFNNEWVDIIDKMDTLRGKIAIIPSQGTVQAKPVVEVQQQAATGNVDLAAVMRAIQNQPTTAVPTQQKPTGGKKSILDLASSNAQFGANVIMQNNKNAGNNSMSALAAMLSGNGNSDTNATAASAFMQLLGAQSQEQAELVRLVGEQGAQQVRALMQSGHDKASAVMQVMANKPKGQSPEEMLMQLLLQQQQQQQQNNNPLAAFAAALNGGNNNNGVPQGYPKGDIIEVAGKKVLMFKSADGQQHFLPL